MKPREYAVRVFFFFSMTRCARLHLFYIGYYMKYSIQRRKHCRCHMALHSLSSIPVPIYQLLPNSQNELHLPQEQQRKHFVWYIFPMAWHASPAPPQSASQIHQWISLTTRTAEEALCVIQVAHGLARLARPAPISLSDPPMNFTYHKNSRESTLCDTDFPWLGTPRPPRPPARHK